MFKTYKGGRLDLQHYKGKTIYFYPIDVFNSDDSEASLSPYSDIRIKIFQKIHGTLVLTFDFQNGVSTDSPANNTIYWLASKDTMNIRAKNYWHECYGIKNTNPVIEDLLFEGVSEVL